MDEPTDFYDFYNRVLRPEIARVEPLRKQAVAKACVIAILAVIGTVVWALTVGRLLGWDNGIVDDSCVIPLFIGVGVWGPIRRKYRDDYQLKLSTAIIKQYNASFSYDRNAAVSEVAFTDSGLFPRYLKGEGRHCCGTDWVSGKIGVTPFEFSDLDASIQNGKSREQLFGGVFFVADFNKNFSGETFVTSRHAFFSSGPETPPGEVVTLEDPEFESMFATHSTSQIEARYILSPALMRRILYFAQQSRTPIAIAFSGTSMFIALFGRSTKLEPVLWQTLQKPSLFFGIWANLEFLCGIVNEMDLNTRIWTKGAPAAEQLPA
jgi:hypothetical protein